jgi:hypothetical protein
MRQSIKGVLILSGYSERNMPATDLEYPQWVFEQNMEA